MFCQKCGFQNQEQAKFCERCGEQLAASAQTEERTEQTENQKDREKRLVDAKGTLALNHSVENEEPLSVDQPEEERTVALRHREQSGEMWSGSQPGEDRTVALRHCSEEETVTVGQSGGKESRGAFPGGESPYMNKGVNWGTPTDSREDYRDDRGKRCQQCGSLLDEDCRFCPVCGKPVSDQISPKRSQERGKNPFPVKGILLVLLILFLLVDVILGGYYLYSKKSAAEPSSQETESGQGEATGEGEALTVTPEVEKEIVHTYDYLLDDCSWEEAFQKCQAQGGYLARIESAEEFDKICREIKAKGMQDYMFFIGARRDPGSSSYYWVDSDNVIGGDPINDANAPLNGYWMNQEPSFQDGAVQETCLEMNYYSDENRWVLNDVPNELTRMLPQFKGKIGYICEYELVR